MLNPVVRPALSLLRLRWLLLYAVGMGVFSGCQREAEPAPPTSWRDQVIELAAQRSQIPVQGWCHGLPAVQLREQSALVDCVRLIDSDLIFPRSVIAWRDGVLLVDKGSTLNEPALGRGAGRVFHYRRIGDGFARELLLAGLDNPSGLSRGRSPSDQEQIYLSTPQSIYRFTPAADDPAATLTRVVAGLPTRGWHYLTAVHATTDALYVTVPSATDHCEAVGGVAYPCNEVARDTPLADLTAVIRRYAIASDGTVSTAFSIAGRGLRDGLAMTSNPVTGTLLVADNGWDDIAPARAKVDPAQLPADELNWVAGDAHYGWPYCHSNQQVTPGYEALVTNCSAFVAPAKLLPPHSAPLALAYTRQRLLVNLHGVVADARRTAFYDVDDAGHPIGELQTLVDWRCDQPSDTAGGRPFGLAPGLGARLFVTDDWNHALMQVMVRAPAKPLE